MPSSNYGPLVDPETPDSIQKFYSGQFPEFVFQADDPKNRSKRNGSLIDLVITIAVWGFIVLSIYPALQQILAEKGVTSSNVIEFIQKEYAKDPESVSTTFLITGIVILGFGISILSGVIKNLFKIFSRGKLWYFGTSSGLSIIQNKKTQEFPWANFQNNVEIESTPFGDKLTLKSKGNSNETGAVQSTQNDVSRKNSPVELIANYLINAAKSDKDIIILNPPNIMEIKRICEEHIKRKNTDSYSNALEL